MVPGGLDPKRYESVYLTVPPSERPKCYFKAQKIMAQISIEKDSFSMFLNENLREFFGNIKDLDYVLSIYSDTEWVQASLTMHYCVSDRADPCRTSST